MLYASDVYTETIKRKKPTCCFSWLSGSTMKEIVEEINYLQATDSIGRELLLEFKQKGDFSAVGEAGTALKNSVYCLGDIVKYVDLPVNTRLAFGQPPTTPCSFTGMLRFEELYFEETIIACSLGGEKIVMVEFPTDSEIQFMAAGNNSEILESILLQEALRHCENNTETYVNSIKVVQNFYPEHVTSDRIVVERRLPPVPDAADDVESVKTAMTDDFTDDESEINNNHQVTVDINTTHQHVISTNFNTHEHETHRVRNTEVQGVPEVESHYEEIQGELGTNAPRKEAEDEHGYLIPVHAYSKIGRDPPVMPKLRNERLTDENGYLKQVRSVDESRRLSSTQLPENVTEMIDKHLRERLDKFLIDSVQEFQRIQFQSEVDETAKDPDRLETDPSPETKEDLQKYLETLFDCDKMTQEPFTPKPRCKRLNSMPGIWDFPPSLCQTEEHSRVQRRRNSTTGDTLQLAKGYRTPIRFSLSNPDATLRRHNLDQVLKPVPRTLEFSDDNAFEISTKFVFEARRSGIATPTGLLDNEQSFVTIDRPPASLGVRQDEYQSAGGDNASYVSRGQVSDTEPRTDSGIFITCPAVWNDPYAIDSDSPYRTGSEGSTWSPPSDVSNASVQEVAQCLQYIGMRDHIVKHFYDEQIDGKQLLELNDHLLSEGFPQLNALDRKKIVDFICGWRPKKL